MTSPSTLPLKHSRIPTLDAERRIVDGDVVVTGDRIAAVGGQGRAKAGAKTIDCTGLVIIPGLIQAHIHLCQTLCRGLADDLVLEDWLAKRIWPLEAAHTPDSIYWSAMLEEDRKSTRLNSSHPSISYAVFCLKKKKSSAEHIL